MVQHRNHYIYLHRRKDTNVIFYVGLGQGKRAYDISNRSKYWKNVYNKTGGRTVEIIFNELSMEEANEIEIALIEFFKPLSILVNLTSGGGGKSGWETTLETRKKQSLAQKGKKKSVKHCNAISLSQVGRVVRDETREKLSKKNKGCLRKDVAIRLQKSYPAFIHKNKIIIPSGMNLLAICREYNLRPSKMWEVIRGSRKSHMGWSLLQETK